jgi:hypothetical protein
MKKIKVEGCAECPLRIEHRGKSFCSRLIQDIGNDWKKSDSWVDPDCPLEDDKEIIT